MANMFPKVDEQSAELIIQYQSASTKREESTSIQRLINLDNCRQYYLGNQWNELAQDTGPFDQAVTPMSSDDKNIPMPVINRTAAIVDGESARLISSTLKPRVDANDRTTRVARSARLSGQVLDDICLKNSFVKVSHKDRKDVVIYGTSFILTSLDLDVEDLKEVPAPMIGCSCGWKINADVASLEGGVVSVKGPAALKMGAAPPEPVGEGQPSVPMAFSNGCPDCGGELKSGIADDQESFDSFGSKLAKKIPSTSISIRNISVFDVYPEGGGRTNDGSVHEYTIESIVPIDWVVKRHIKGKEVKARSLQDMNNILKWHPSGIDLTGSGGYFGSQAYNSEKRWAVYRITVRGPFFNEESKTYEPDGRLIISANDTVLYHGPLMIHHEESGRRIPRVMLHPAQYTQVEGSIFGIGIPQRVMKIQDAINTCVAQVQYARHVFGNPRLWIPNGASIEYMGQTYGGYQGDTFSYSGDEKPDMQQGAAMHPDWHSEVEMYYRQMSEVANQADIDRGIPPGGVPSASGLMYLGEQAGTARKPLSQRFAEREANIFRHCLELANVAFVYPSQLMAADRNDNRTVKTFTSTDLLWQVDVKVEVQPAFDSAVFRRQATQEALASKLLVPTTPLQQRKVAEALGVPQELDAVPSQQIEAAENEWIDFQLSDERIDPVVKAEFDDHAIHIEQHFTDFRSADGKPLNRFFNLITLATDGLDEELTMLQQAEARLKQQPPGEAPLPGMINPETGEEDPLSALQNRERWEKDRELQKVIQGIPKNTQLRIFELSMKRLMQDKNFNNLSEEDKPDAVAATFFLSHIKAHINEKNKRDASAMIGMPSMPAPGGAPAGGSQSQ